MSGLRQALQARLREAEQQLADLGRVHAEIVAASRDSNADDEHDPEGATIAFERQQVVALTEQAQATRQDLVRALQLLDEGRYGVCERCDRPIGEGRLEARPAARTCLGCASGRV